MKQEDFLDRVRQAVAAGRPYRVHVPPVSPNAGYVGAPGDLCEALAAEIQGVGGMPQVVDSWDAARSAVRQWIAHYGARSAICWQHSTLEQLGLRDLLAGEGVAASSYEELAALPLAEQRARILNAELGISSADFAVAETGTLAVCAAPGQERTCSLAPLVHLAVVQRSQIVPDLFDLFARLAERGLPSNVALISGPSKTGDIELELTTGVHGPGFWHVIIIRSGQ